MNSLSSMKIFLQADPKGKVIDDRIWEKSCDA